MNSLLHNSDNIYGASYNRREIIDLHSDKHHIYQVSRTVMDADLVISVPKLKVHKKVGVTLNVKNLVGIVTNKNCLTHYTLLPPKKGGDQYPDDLFNPLERALISTERWMYDHLLAPGDWPLEFLHRSIYALHNIFTKRLGIQVTPWKRKLDAGNWYGNNTAWRMAVDLLQILYYADKGNLFSEKQRNTFSIIDGIVGGENEGPLNPDPVPSEVLVGGIDLVATDIVATRIMGFDPYKIPIYNFFLKNYPDIKVLCGDRTWASCLSNKTSSFLNFKPHLGWLGHIEIGDAHEYFSHWSWETRALSIGLLCEKGSSRHRSRHK
jgi:hypothetical protein